MDLEFRLKAAFKTSGDPAPAVDAIQEFLEGEAPKVLAKGAPEGEEAKIKSWNVKDNRIDLEIVSGRYVRSHDAIIRLRKPLPAKLERNTIWASGVLMLMSLSLKWLLKNQSVI